jgi:hypothetical protein
MQPSRDEIHASVKEALARHDESWYQHILKQDISGCTLSSDEVAGVLDGTLAAAVEVAREIEQTYPALSPAELASSLLLNIVPMDDNVCMGSLPLLGLYQPAGRQILFHEKTLATIEAFIAEYDLESLTPARDLRACVLYHEIFHAIEDETPRIFTRCAMLQRKLFGLVSWRRGLASASEIGAIHFSRLMARISYSPCIFEYYLLLTEGRINLDDLPG